MYESGAAKVQAGENRHTRQVYARCGAEIATSIRWVRKRNEGVVETPWWPTNLNGVENNFQRGICGKETGRSSQGRREKTLRWFHSKQRTQAAMLKRAFSFCCAIPTAKSDARLTRGLYRQNCRIRKKTVTKGVPLAELSASLAISINTVAK